MELVAGQSVRLIPVRITDPTVDQHARAATPPHTNDGNHAPHI